MAVTRYVRSKINIHVQENEIKDVSKVKENNQLTYTFSGKTLVDMEPDELRFYVYFAHLLIVYGGDLFV